MPLRCPYCHSPDLRPASVHRHDTWIQRKLSQAYRCRNCGRRSWHLEPVLVGLTLATALVLLTPFTFLGYHTLSSKPRTAPQATEDALTVLRRKANQGDVPAQLELGRRHAESDGMLTNTTEATRWYAQAAQAGDREGQFRYGQALLKGAGVVQDYQTALDWLKRAAEQNHGKAQQILGQMYSDGRGTPVDKVSAYVWLSLATAQGQEDAARLRDQVLMQLPANQVIEAQGQARALHARLNGNDGETPINDVGRTPAALPGDGARTP
jgi:TPR repeat protein